MRLLASFFVLFARLCSPRVSWKAHWLLVVPFWIILDRFGYLWDSKMDIFSYIYIHIYLYIDIHIYHCFLCCDGISSSPSYPTHGGYTDVQRSDMRMVYESKHCFFMLLLAILAYTSSINCNLFGFICS